MARGRCSKTPVKAQVILVMRSREIRRFFDLSGEV